MAAAPVFSRREFALGLAAAGALGAAKLLAQPAAPAGRFSILGFTKPFQHLELEALVDTVAEIGWDGIECPVRPKGQIEPVRAADELPRLAEALKRRGKEIGVLTTAITRVDQPHAEPLLRTAAKLGIRRYRLGDWRYQAQRPMPEQLAEIAARLRDLAALNRELGLQAGFQNHSGSDWVGAPVWDLWQMIEKLDPRHLGTCFDIGHATVEGGMAWPLHARLMQSRFAAVFVKDFVWERTPRGWEPRWVMLGEGMVDPRFFRWIQTTDFAGPISQHHEYDHGHGARMIAKMRKDLAALRLWLEA